MYVLDRFKAEGESKVPVLPLSKPLKNMAKSNTKKCLEILQHGYWSHAWWLNQNMWNVSKNFLTNEFENHQTEDRCKCGDKIMAKKNCCFCFWKWFKSSGHCKSNFQLNFVFSDHRVYVLERRKLGFYLGSLNLKGV